MNTQIALTFSVASVLLLAACSRSSNSTETGSPSDEPPSMSASSPSALDKPEAATQNFETSRLGRAIDVFEAEPSPLHSAAVEKAFADVDVEIAKLRERIEKTTGTDRAEATLKASNLTTYKNAEVVRFAKTKVRAAIEPSPTADARSGLQKMKDGATDAVNSVQGDAKKTGEAIDGSTR